LIATAVAFGSIYIGFHHPVTFAPHTWMIIISIYTLIAAGLPVWVILQPRDFTNVQILYGGMLMLLIGIIGTGFKGINISYPIANISGGVKHLGLMWPMLFITLACGAISGFHALVCVGTTAKQVTKQSYSRKIGYGAMLLESMLALLVLVALATSLNYSDYLGIVWPEPGMGKSNPILAFALAVGGMFHNATGLPMYVGSIFGILMVEGFVITTLDSSIRFIRYILEEVWQVLFTSVPSILMNHWFNALIAVGGMWALASANTFTALWPIFGSVNQLMAALTLITLTMWLSMHGLKTWFTIFPAIFMTVTTIASLVILLVSKYLPAKNYALSSAATLLLLLAVALTGIAFKKGFELFQRGRNVALAGDGNPAKSD
ncbi:MAG: carbon starvation protein A, partial [Calditrichaeota bacterium]|nr:carbon starvation protein A [Calditrichota bacterium]